MGSITPMEKPERRCKKWRLEVSCGKDPEGKRIRHTKVFHGTKTEAKKALAEFEAYWGVSKIVDQSFGGYCEEYLRRKEGTIAETSLNSTRQRLATLRYIYGEDTKLSQLTPDVIDAGMVRLLTKGGPQKKKCKPSYVGSLKAALASVLLDAYKRGALARDPIPDTKFYSQRAPKRDVPLTAELVTVLAHVDPRDHRQMAILLVITLGLRRQEAVALKFSDIDYSNNRIYIRHTARWVDGVESVVEMTKTEAGRRDLPIPSFLPALIEKRRQTLEDDIALALRTGELIEAPSELYVCANHLGERTSLTSVTKWWCNHREGLGFTCALHDLRHAYITALAEQNVHPVVAARLAGHSDVGTTLNVYSHAHWDKTVEAVESIEGVFIFDQAPGRETGERPTDGRAITRRKRAAEGAYNHDPDIDDEAAVDPGEGLARVNLTNNNN